MTVGTIAGLRLGRMKYIMISMKLKLIWWIEGMDGKIICLCFPSNYHLSKVTIIDKFLE